MTKRPYDPKGPYDRRRRGRYFFPRGLPDTAITKQRTEFRNWSARQRADLWLFYMDLRIYYLKIRAKYKSRDDWDPYTATKLKQTLNALMDAYVAARNASLALKELLS